jgi:hypothetical protein
VLIWSNAWYHRYFHSLQVEAEDTLVSTIICPPQLLIEQLVILDRSPTSTVSINSVQFLNRYPVRIHDYGATCGKYNEIASVIHYPLINFLELITKWGICLLDGIELQNIDKPKPNNVYHIHQFCSIYRVRRDRTCF